MEVYGRPGITVTDRFDTREEADEFRLTFGNRGTYGGGPGVLVVRFRDGEWHRCAR
jgi:hypothetical protein